MEFLNLLISYELGPIDLTFFIVFGVCFLLFIILVLFEFISNKKTEKIIAKEIKENKNKYIGDNHLTEDTVETNEQKEVVAPATEVTETKDEAQDDLVPQDVLSTEEVVEQKVEQEQPLEEVKTLEEEQPLEAETYEDSFDEKVEKETLETKEEVEATVEEDVFEENTNNTVEDVKALSVETESNSLEAVEEKEVKSHGREYNGKYEVYKDNKFYRYRLKASNGEILLESELYSTKNSCLSAIESLKRNISKGKAQIIKDKKKNFKFKLLAANHRVIAISANYATEARAQSALESVKRFALTNDINEIELPADQLDSSLVEIEKVKQEDKKGGKFVIKKDVNGEYSWSLKANNGEVLCQSNGYALHQSIESAILNFKVAVEAGKFYIYTDKAGKYQFKLYSASGRLTMVGESYDTALAVQSVVTSILNFVALAPILDKSNVEKKTTTKTTTKTTVKTVIKG